MPYGPRSFDGTARHICGRCTRNVKLRSCRWQRGKLLCKYCIDDSAPSRQGPGLIGQREVMIQAVLSDGKVELAPPPLLSDPFYQEAEDDILI